jgi:hypothetical protein
MALSFFIFMKFTNDRQRKAVMAKFNRFSELYKPYKCRNPDTVLVGKLGKFEDVWRPETELYDFDRCLNIPADEHRGFNIALTEMSPDDFLDLQYKATKKKWGPTTKRQFETDSIDPSKVDMFEKILVGGESDYRLPVPVVVYDNNKVTGFQEGRHRGFAAKMAGLDSMPVLIATKRSE